MTEMKLRFNYSVEIFEIQFNIKSNQFDDQGYSSDTEMDKKIFSDENITGELFACVRRKGQCGRQEESFPRRRAAAHFRSSPTQPVKNDHPPKNKVENNFLPKVQLFAKLLKVQFDKKLNIKERKLYSVHKRSTLAKDRVIVCFSYTASWQPHDDLEKN